MSIKPETNMFCVCLLALLATNCVKASPQKNAFYNQTNCNGPSQTITTTNNNLRGTWMTNATSTLVSGVWKIDVGNGTVQIELYPNDAYPPKGRCINKSDWPVNGTKNLAIYGVERFGPPDMSTSQLILYTEPYFRGTNYTINNSMERLNTQNLLARIQSFARFGNDTWTLFSGTKYSGTNTTLTPSSANGRDQFAYNREAFLFVGSVLKAGGGSGSSSIVASLLISLFASLLTFVV